MAAAPCTTSRPGQPRGGHHLAAPSTFAALGKLTPQDWAEAKATVRAKAEQEKAQRSTG